MFKTFLLVNIFFTIFLVNSSIYSQSSGEKLKAIIAAWDGLQSLRASVTVNGMSGQLSYLRPYNFHLKLSDGRVISANRNILWIYSPKSSIAGKQDLRGGTGGVGGLLSGYENIVDMGNTLKLTSSTRHYQEIYVTVGADKIIRSLRMKAKGSSSYTEITFSGVQKNVGLPSSLFNFHAPANAQVVENPLNQRE